MAKIIIETKSEIAWFNVSNIFAIRTLEKVFYEWGKRMPKKNESVFKLKKK